MSTAGRVFVANRITIPSDHCHMRIQRFVEVSTLVLNMPIENLVSLNIE